MKAVTLTNEQYTRLVNLLTDYSDLGPHHAPYDSDGLIELRDVVSKSIEVTYETKN